MKQIVMALLLAVVSCAGWASPVVVGSKNFTESVVLGELARIAAQQKGIVLEHRKQLGGTRILWRALREGDIDVYPEYTGTITQELLPGSSPRASFEQIRAELRPLGIGMTDSLGFNNTYALGMGSDEASKLHIVTISDLRKHPDLRFGFSNEFMHRDDGWPGLKKVYGLSQSARGVDHDLAYRGLASGALDVIDLYSTDADIAYYHLRVLQDDRQYFPRYDAVYLYRLDLAERNPALIKVLNGLAATIDARQMRAMNKAVKIDGKSEGQAAAAFLGVTIAAPQSRFWQRLGQRTLEHLRLTGISLLLAMLIALPLGVFAARRKRLGQVVMTLVGLLQTVPSLAMFVFMIPLFGIGAAPAIAALFFYSLLPIVRNTHAGLVGIDPALRESVLALGLPRRTRLWRIELPLALRTILAGVKTAAVINVCTATLGALIGAGGYGQPILTGIRLDDIGLILQGAIPAAILALLVQGIFELVERIMTPRGLRLESAA